MVHGPSVGRPIGEESPHDPTRDCLRFAPHGVIKKNNPEISVLTGALNSELTPWTDREEKTSELEVVSRSEYLSEFSVRYRVPVHVQYRIPPEANPVEGWKDGRI